MRFWLRSTVAVVAAVSLSAGVFWPTSHAEAQTPKRYDANNQTALSESMEAVIQGGQKFVARDLEGAIALFRKAVKLQPRNAVAQYALGEALLAQNKPQEAEAPLATADDAAPQGSPAKARIVFVLATCKERLRKWDEAKELWRRYLELAQSKSDAGAFPQSGTERLRMVDELALLDATYANVRARIATTGVPGAAPAADAGK